MATGHICEQRRLKRTEDCWMVRETILILNCDMIELSVSEWQTKKNSFHVTGP